MVLRACNVNTGVEQMYTESGGHLCPLGDNVSKHQVDGNTETTEVGLEIHMCVGIQTWTLMNTTYTHTNNVKNVVIK